ncbi:MAG: cell envelope biogenesis protein OmpA [Bacteroidota bacterium]
MGTSTTAKDKYLLERLREALLHDDRQELAELRHILNTREKLEERINPIIEEHLLELEQNFPDTYLQVVQKVIDRRLQQKQDELINIIYPRLGIMVRKYISDEIRMWMERLQENIRRTSHSVFWWRRRKSAAEIIIDNSRSIVEEVYVISHESGLLLGSASSVETVDKDMIAGMLTAIKAFVEDAFKRTDEELQGIRYGAYEIIIYNFFNYYIAIAAAGSISEQERDELADKILEFAAKELNHDLQEPDPIFYAKIKRQLEAYFIAPYKISPPND